MKNFDIVFYHKGCVDGFTAAMIAHEHLPLAQYVAVGYEGAFPVEIKDLSEKAVLFVDFCPNDDILKALVNTCLSVVILDHHVTAMKRLENCLPFNAGSEIEYALAMGTHQQGTRVKLPLAAFDMKKSGARLTWEFFTGGNPKVPQIVAYTEDYDLWNWTTPEALPDSEAVNAYIQSHSFDFELYRALWSMLDTHHGLEMAASVGNGIVQFENKLVRSIVEQYRLEKVNIPGIGVIVVASVNSPVLQSKVGNELAKLSPTGIGFIYNYVSADLTKVSVRSIKEVDITPITSAFPGGGGHKNSGGFSLEKGASLATGA